MKIFIDDERMPIETEEGEWVIIRDPDTAIKILNANSAFITHISFDNDLGFKTEGRDIMTQMFGTPEIAPMTFPRLIEIRVHSANTIACQAMIDLARSAQKAGILRCDVIIDKRSALYERYDTSESWYDDEYETEKERLEALISSQHGTS